MKTITLTGYLGGDREIRETRERTRTVRWYNSVAEQWEESEATLAGREFARLSLATHESRGGRWVTRWHRLIVWNLDRGMENFHVRLARKGDRVRVTGQVETRRFEDKDGRERRVRQIVVEELHILQPKPRRQVA